MTTETATDRLAGTWVLNPVHSSLDFAVKAAVVNFRAGFGEIDAKIEDGRLTGSAKASSIIVKNDDFYGHLLAPDFLHAEAHPEITFESDSITVDGDDVTLDGTLTLAGKTNPLHAAGTIAGPLEAAHGTNLGLTLEATFDRTAFGIEYNNDFPDGGKVYDDDVTLTVELEFVPR